jgi:hypothetical protein
VRGPIFAISDVHVGCVPNRRIVEELQPASSHDWLLLCGDVGETLPELTWALELLVGRLATGVWTPCNHELWTLPDTSCELRGERRYSPLVAERREIGVLTPEDPYPVWRGTGGPITIVPLFLLCEYSFGRNVAAIPRTTWHDGVRFEEVSLGYAREWRHCGPKDSVLSQIWPRWAA